eukprot:CAMPEP_0194273974 /NCGR_PEP_ID=MMETSP0169-20130528/7191_1 /TAXON_ID=218684 /ORGANISM="Corethron pennatum, Strain L29A3" /LENGTH=152 /DNA_ID=CAMNT_0039017069 /DNA_START=80 /DNA_END=538 /DNA_ORIENTATION=-
MSDEEATLKKKDEKTYEDKCRAVSVISQPLASKKSTKKIHKLIKKASQAKVVRRGVKEVIKALRKNEIKKDSLCVIAGDIYPLDVISHLPILLEEKGVPYIFVPAKRDLGAAAGTKRPTSCVLLKGTEAGKSFESQDLLDVIISEANDYTPK